MKENYFYNLFLQSAHRTTNYVGTAENKSKFLVQIQFFITDIYINKY